MFATMPMEQQWMFLLPLVYYRENRICELRKKRKLKLNELKYLISFCFTYFTAFGKEQHNIRYQPSHPIYLALIPMPSNLVHDGNNHCENSLLIHLKIRILDNIWTSQEQTMHQFLFTKIRLLVNILSKF